MVNPHAGNITTCSNVGGRAHLGRLERLKGKRRRPFASECGHAVVGRGSGFGSIISSESEQFCEISANGARALARRASAARLVAEVRRCRPRGAFSHSLR